MENIEEVTQGNSHLPFQENKKDSRLPIQGEVKNSLFNNMLYAPHTKLNLAFWLIMDAQNALYSQMRLGRF